jgi:GNAT superfamily N-acetyltransferase
MTVATEPSVLVTRYHDTYRPAILRLCKEFSEESLKEYGLEITPQKMDGWIEACRNIGFVLVVDGEPVGMIAAIEVNNHINGKRCLQEIVWYVDKNHRSHGRLLLQYLEEQAKNSGIELIVMCLMMNSQAERIGKVYERMGYKKFEIQYLKEIQL